MSTKFGRAFLAFFVALSFGTAAYADEGLWTFDNFPVQTVKDKYGVTIDQGWRDHVRAAAVRLSVGCSASVVSAKGLVMTNHHCAASCLQDLSKPGADYITDGFSAKTPENEKPCPGMQAEILLSSSDVTGAIANKTTGTSGDTYVRARDAAIATMEKESCAGKEATQRCQIIPLYQGGQYWLYTYRRYSDVRLVFAVGLNTGFFGGDPDNFSFPRYCLDVSFMRLYDKGKPAVTPEHLRWAPETPKDGQPVFVAGNPGGTSRMLTATQLVGLRDVTRPALLLQLSELRGRYLQFSTESDEHRRDAVSALLSVENTLKRLRGEQLALTDPKLIDGKSRDDDALKAKVDADPKLKADIGDPWSDIAEAERARAGLQPTYNWTEARAGSGSVLYRYARILVRAAAERPKPNDQRLREYADARLPALEKDIVDAGAIAPDFERLQLEFWLSKLRENLTADSVETKVFLGKQSPEDWARALAASRVAEPAYRKNLWDGGQAAINASDDPLIQFIRRTDETARSARALF